METLYLYVFFILFLLPLLTKPAITNAFKGDNP
jgi:hypothetical protein